MCSVSDWLASIGLDRYAAVFAENEVDFDTLRLLSDGDLQQLGLALGPRRKLLHALIELDIRPASGAGNGAPALPPPAVVPQAEGDSERRQLTVFFCDMVGFTDLASRVDPEVLQGIIRTYEDACAVCITRYEGYVFQRLGDGIVAFFGYPLAHEGEAERAIHAGLAVIDSLAMLEVPEVGRIQVRIGIATGLVVVSAAGKGAVGATMNLAARLQGVARVGHVVVSDSVRQLAGGRFLYDNLGEQALKGFAQPTPAWRVLGVSASASRFDAANREGLTPMVGREREIELLMDRWNQARDGAGRVVLLAGETGVGKSRVLDAFREQLSAQGAHILRFQCSPYHANSAFYPFIDHLERALKFGREEPAQSRLDKLRAMLVDQYARPQEDLRFLAAMLSIATESNVGAPALTPQRFKDETLRAIVGLTMAVARKQAAVMLFEDTHWIDPTSLAFLDLLIGQSRDFPLLVVLTHRPEFVATWSEHDHVTELNLSRLSRAQCGLLVTRLTQGRALPADLLDTVLARTDGVPLFVEELTKSILESNELRQAGNTYVYRHDSDPIVIPATLRDSLMARLDRNAGAKEVAQIGSVIGREFSLELIRAALPKTAIDVDGALRQLVDSGLIIKRGMSREATYTFKHTLVQDVAYDSLLKSRRQELHATIATAIEERFPSLKEINPEILARHLSIAGQTRGAVSLWRAAADLATRRMALQESIAHLHNALRDLAALTPSAERDRAELDLHAALGTAFMLARGWAAPEVEKAYARANELSASLTDTDESIWTLWGICVFRMVRGEIEHAREIGARVMALASPSGSRRARLVAHMLGVQLSMYGGNCADAQAHWRVADDLYSEGEDLALISHFSTDLRLTVRLHGAHILWILGLPDQAAAVCTQKDAIARSLGHPYSLSWALTWGAIPLLDRGDYPGLLKSLDEGIRIAEEHGFAYTGAIGAMARGWARAQCGAPAEGIADMRAGLSAFRATGAEIVVPFFQTLLAELLCGAGEKQEALAILDAATAQVERWGERWQEAEIHRVRGLLFAARPERDLVRAETSFRQAIDVARAQGAKGWELRAQTALACLLRAQDQHQVARSALVPLLAQLEEGADTKDVRAARELLGSLEPGHGESVKSVQ